MMNDIGKTAGGEVAVVGGADNDNRFAPNDKIALSIKNVAQMFKISSLSLRLYELRGLIRRERAGRTWVYSWSDCERIALIVKARQAGLRIRELKPVIVAMSKQSQLSVADAGRLQTIRLIQQLEGRQQAIGKVLGELYRIDWELSDCLGVKDSGGTDAGADRA
jgi:DNA-binding transcriptional MerR regulator